MGYIDEFIAYRKSNPIPDKKQINELVNEWLSRYPSGRRSQLEQQILDPVKELDALTELWVYETLTCLGLTIEVNPQVRLVPGADPRTPDFMVTDGISKCYVEVTLLKHEPPDRTRKLEAEITNVLRSIKGSPFHVFLSSEGTLTNMPSKKKVLQPVEALLSRYTPDDLRRMEYPPSCIIRHENWQMSAAIEPKSLPSKPNAPLSIAGPGWAGGVEDAQRFRKKLKAKSNHYPNLDAPLVVAVNSPDLIRPDDTGEVLIALLGTEQVSYVMGHPEIPSKLTRKGDGLWLRGDLRAQNSRVAGVWCWSAHPYGDATTPRMYLNTETPSKLPSAFLRLPYTKVFTSTGEHKAQPGDSLENILGVESSWPRPFVRHYDTKALFACGIYVPTDGTDTL